MPAPLSVVIPVLNSEKTLPEVLGALKPGLDRGIIRELILTDGGSQDDTFEIGDAVGARWIEAPRGRGSQLIAGAEAARGDWLLFLHSDTQLSEDWAEIAIAHFKTPDHAGYFDLSFDVAGFAPWFTAAWANFRSRAFGLPYGDQALLISQTLYGTIGGYAPLPLMEDVDIARRLRGQLKRLPAKAQTSAARYQETGWLKQGARNLWRLMKFKSGVPAAKLATHYKLPQK